MEQYQLVNMVYISERKKLKGRLVQPICRQVSSCIQLNGMLKFCLKNASIHCNEKQYSTPYGWLDFNCAYDMKYNVAK